jgi:predicted PurR-regulated permease PerM
MTARNQILFWTGLALFLIAVTWVLRDVIFPFVAGLILAYLLNPLVTRLERWRIGRLMSSMIVAGLIVIAFSIGLILFVPFVANQILDLIIALPAMVTRLQAFVTQEGAAFIERLGGPDAVQDVRTAIAEIMKQASSWLGGILSSIWSGGEAIVNAFLLIVITPVIAFYLLIDWPRMTATIDSWLPRRYDDTIRLLWREMDHSIAGFLKGQLLVCLILGIFYAVALQIIGLDYGILIGLSAGLLSFIPYVGSLTGFLISTAVAVVQFWPEWWMIGAVMGVFIFGQLFEGNVLAPWVVGEATGVHPVWLMFALFAFGSLLGFVGLLLAVPLAAVVSVLGRFAIQRYMASEIYLGIPNAPPEEGRPKILGPP